MIRDHFRILLVDLTSGRGRIVTLDGRDTFAGGSGLAALLFNNYADMTKPWNDPVQPLIFTIGPLTGYYPLMSKTVCAFKSPYHDQYAESHAGGRSAMALRFADLDGLVITGKAKKPCSLGVASQKIEIKDTHYLWGMDVRKAGKKLRHIFKKGSGHRSILRIGPAGENESAMALINVDTYRHFGRLGGGAVMGSKNLKGIVIQGDAVFPLAAGKEYAKLFEEVHHQLTSTDMMKKYHDLGTTVNMKILNELKMLPIRNLQKTGNQAIEGITGERFAKDTLLRNMACSGCPVGCIHVGFVREKFTADHRYFYRQVSYDHEPIFAAGAMLEITDNFAVLDVIDATEKMGLDVMSGCVALAWATEALENGIISEAETIVPLKFGDAETYEQAVFLLGKGENDFYRLLGRGTMQAAEHYGGKDYACVLGQEMAGYATGEVFFVSQALGLRHSHLDSGGYAYDQKHDAKSEAVDKIVDFLVQDERVRVFITSMVACLFARGIYSEELLANCLRTVGYDTLAANISSVARHIQELRWHVRMASGYDPAAVKIPKRFHEVTTSKGQVDSAVINSIKDGYQKAIYELAQRGAELIKAEGR